MRTRTVSLPSLLRFPPLTAKEMSLVCQYLAKDRIFPSLRDRMQVEVKRQSSDFIRVQMPVESKAATERRRTWRLLIRGPIGGWERKGKRIRRKWDPAVHRFKLRFALLVESRDPLRVNLVYDGDLFEWWIARALVTGQMRNFFECWYCGKQTWRRRSSARFCNDRCRMRYHLAEHNRDKLLRLPPGGRRQRAYREMLKKGAEVGLMDMPIARRSRQATRRRLRRERQKRAAS